MELFCKGHTCLFTCYLTPLSVRNGIGPAAYFVLKKQDWSCKVEKNNPFSTLDFKRGLVLQLPHKKPNVDYNLRIMWWTTKSKVTDFHITTIATERWNGRICVCSHNQVSEL
jgi:hypothetical protein